jgi:hypothetical protein
MINAETGHVPIRLFSMSDNATYRVLPKHSASSVEVLSVSTETKRLLHSS